MKLHIINGPNMDQLGKREPKLYGKESLDEILKWLERQCTSDELHFFQSAGEGELVQALHRAEEQHADGIVLNAAAYSHTSLALVDALRCIHIPVVEVHLTNIHARDTLRQHSLTGAQCSGVISGLGKFGYLAAIEYMRRGE